MVFIIWPEILTQPWPMARLNDPWESLKICLKKHNNGHIKSRLSSVLLYYRNAPYSVRKISPSVALNNINYVTIKDRINPNFVHDIKTRNLSARIGDVVLCLNLGNGPKWYQASIVEILGTNLYNVHIHDLDILCKRYLQDKCFSNNNQCTLFGTCSWQWKKFICSWMWHRFPHCWYWFKW